MQHIVSSYSLSSRRIAHHERGMTLIMVLMILIVVSLLGVGAAQIAMMSERGARNDRDVLVALQSAEAGMVDAEGDIDPGAVGVTSTRRALFDGKSIIAFPDTDCGTSGSSQGLCAAPPLTGKPAWLTVDFTNAGTSAPSTAYGTFTGNTFTAGGAGVQPAQAPRYIIEPIMAPSGDPAHPDVLYRVTTIGFGPRPDIQVVLQMLYRI